MRRCLTRNTQQRLRDIGEARIAIEELQANPSVVEASVRPWRAQKKPVVWMAAVAALALALAALATINFRGRSPESGPAVHSRSA
jgi:hypothetical protein